MTVKYVNANWIFDNGRFGEAVLRACDQYGISDIAEMCDVSDSTIYNWSHGHWHKEAPYPNMTNFLIFCNLMDLNPSLFFWVGEGDCQ